MTDYKTAIKITLKDKLEGPLFLERTKKSEKFWLDVVNSTRLQPIEVRAMAYKYLTVPCTFESVCPEFDGRFVKTKFKGMFESYMVTELPKILGVRITRVKENKCKHYTKNFLKNAYIPETPIPRDILAEVRLITKTVLLLTEAETLISGIKFQEIFYKLPSISRTVISIHSLNC